MGNKKRVVVVGGGAAGLVAAISAARAGARVAIVEAGKRVGQKILKTGNRSHDSHNLRTDYRSAECEP